MCSAPGWRVADRAAKAVRSRSFAAASITIIALDVIVIIVRRIFKTRKFAQLIESIGLTDLDILDATREMEAGLIDANLGGNVYKKRIALGGKGKRGGARTIVATRHAGHWIFIYAFAKSETGNIGRADLHKLQQYAQELLSLTDHGIQKLVATRKLQEVTR